VLVVDRAIRGTWTHERSGGTATIEITPFARITKAV
jgi:hypothetical protein